MRVRIREHDRTKYGSLHLRTALHDAVGYRVDLSLREGTPEQPLLFVPFFANGDGDLA
jgi:hypothetical protein